MEADPKTPQELIAEHQPLVYSLAKQIHRSLPPHIRLEDVVCYGQVGLTQAARTYQPQERSTFSTFAFYRVRGAILDGLTKMSWSSRAAYQRLKAAQHAAEVIESSHDERPANLTDARHEASWLLETSERLSMIYLMTGGAGDEIADTQVEDYREKSPDELAEQSELHELLREKLLTLPETEGRLIHLVYFENLSLSEAAQQLGHTRSWASRVHSRVLAKLARSFHAIGASESP